MKIGVIGGGTMGTAIVHGILRKKLALKRDIVVSEPVQKTRDYLARKYGIVVTDDSARAADGADVIILAVKPQELAAVTGQIAGQMKSQVVISIAAGISLETISRNLRYGRVVRAMPNTPAQVGKGMTAWTASAELMPAEREKAAAVLASLGEEHYFSDEKYIDMATAISGSGPAYVFLFIEAFIDAGVHIGLPRDVAAKLVIETVAGSTEIIGKMSRHPAELKNMVTSPGGTTSEALLHLESGGMRSLIIHAVTAAYNKAKTLGGK